MHLYYLTGKSFLLNVIVKEHYIVNKWVTNSEQGETFCLPLKLFQFKSWQWGKIRVYLFRSIYRIGPTDFDYSFFYSWLLLLCDALVSSFSFATIKRFNVFDSLRLWNSDHELRFWTPISPVLIQYNMMKWWSEWTRLLMTFLKCYQRAMACWLIRIEPWLGPDPIMKISS